MKLGSLDLNLLRLFDALARERHLTRAGRRVGLSQPAASAALGRLRASLGDPLFVRGPRGLEPTERALALAPVVSRALEDLAGALDGTPFDPARSDRSVALGVVDPVAAVLGPPLVARVAREAPLLSLSLRTYDGSRGLVALEDGEIDLLVAPCPHPPAWAVVAPLYTTRWVALTRPDHPYAAAPSLERWLAARHVGTGSGWIDGRLAARGLTRQLVVTVSSGLAVPWLVAGEALVATVPAAFAEAVAPSLGLVVTELPELVQAPLTLATIVSRRRADRAPVMWLVRCLRAVAPGSDPA